MKWQDQDRDFNVGFKEGACDLRSRSCLLAYVAPRIATYPSS